MGEAPDPLRALALRVAEMRELQRRFFRGDKSVVGEAKAREREVDQAVAEILHTDPQPRLF